MRNLACGDFTRHGDGRLYGNEAIGAGQGHSPLSAIRHPPSAIRFPLSAIRYPLLSKTVVEAFMEVVIVRLLEDADGGWRKAEERP